MGMAYSTLFQLRAKDAAGAVAKTFKAASTVGTLIGFAQPMPEYDEHVLLDLTDDSDIIGNRDTVDVVFEAAGSIVIPGDTGFDSLEATLNAGCALNCRFELSLDGGTTWLPCLLSSATPGKLEDKNAGKHMECSFTLRALRAASFLTA